jgi:hypothetical protein
MKTTVDIPSNDELRDAMRFTKSRTKRECKSTQELRERG